MRTLVFAAAIALLLLSQPTHATEPTVRDNLNGVVRILFLGDSITHAGKYVAYVETYTRLREPKLAIEFVNCGLSSETVSGLSEEGHAGGKFPRPDLHERLDRVLAEVKPDVVVACYGMNDGIYFPLAEERFAKYRDGMELLRKKCTAAGVRRILHVTPPVFDPLPIKARVLPAGRDAYPQPYEGYNEVLDAYSDWLVTKRAASWDVIDTHTPMNAFIAEKRKSDPAFTLAKDGVHPGNLGHWLIARPILANFGVPSEELQSFADGEAAISAKPHGLEVLKLVEQRLTLMHDAYLTATKHQRPGVKEGLPLDEAKAKAHELEQKINSLLLQN